MTAAQLACFALLIVAAFVVLAFSPRTKPPRDPPDDDAAETMFDH